MMKSTYTTLTIGPLPGILMTARKTRELWASSYLLSYLMREICHALQKAGHEVLLPSTDNIKAENAFGAGLYPDKIIFKPSPTAEQDHPEVIESLFLLVFKNVHQELEKIDGQYFPNAKGRNTRFNNPFLLADVSQYLKAYFKCYAVQVDLDPEKDKTKQDTIYCAFFNKIRQSNVIIGCHQDKSEYGFSSPPSGPNPATTAAIACPITPAATSPWA